MAGTLIAYDPITGTPGPLPGCDDFLPELGHRFRHVVTTGDEAGSARNLLDSFGLAAHFEKIYGDLFAPVGKPFGEIIRSLNGNPAGSLAIGDRILADVASDTPEVVTILINQDGDRCTAGVVAMVVWALEREGRDFPGAFTQLCRKSAPDPDLSGGRAGGQITHSWRCDLGFPCRLMRFVHPVLDGDRMIVQI